MADFTTWDRSTIEQFARDATDKLVANREAIDELVNAMRSAQDAAAFMYCSDAFHILEEAIAKHTTDKEAA